MRMWRALHDRSTIEIVRGPKVVSRKARQKVYASVDAVQVPASIERTAAILHPGMVNESPS